MKTKLIALIMLVCFILIGYSNITTVNRTPPQQKESNKQKYAEENRVFLEKNKVKEGVITTKSGLQYIILREGKGERPGATDIVKVHYRGAFIDGKEFDSSYKRNESIKFPLNRVIKGWTEGLQLMKPGAKFKFFIPSDLAYGENDRGTIPGNSSLIFVVELLGFKKIN
jgi:FKBP-type peptidyl-prolyl cis-trans isomerase FkpA